MDAPKLVLKLSDHILNFLVIFLVNFLGIRFLGTWIEFGSVFSVSIILCPTNKLDPRELLSKEPLATLDSLLGVSEPTEIRSNKLLILYLVIQFTLLITFFLCIFDKTVCCYLLVYLPPFSFIKQFSSVYFLAC